MAKEESEIFTDVVSETEQEMARCLTGDAKAVAKVCTDIVSWTGLQPMQRPSWNNPARNVSLQVYLKDIPPGTRIRYASALEKILDIIQLFLDLVIDFLNKIPHVTEAFSHSEMAIPYRRLSLPALVWMLWARIKYINHHLNRQVQVSTVSRINGPSKDKQVQTSECSFSTCETCQTSQETVCQVTTALEHLCVTNNIKDSAIMATRKEMVDEIYHISQTGAMRKWCKSILQDIETITGHMRVVKHQNAKLFNQLKTFKNENLLTTSKLKDLSKEKEELIVTTEKAVESKATSIIKINELGKKCRAKTAECEDWKQKYNDLEASTAGMKKEVSDLQFITNREKERNAQLNNELQKKSAAIEEIRQEMSKMKKEFAAVTYSMKDDIASRDLTVSSQLEKLKQMEDRAQTAEKQVEDLKKELKKEKEHGEEIWKSLDSLKEQKKSQDDKLEKNYAEMDEMLRRLNEVEENILAMPKFQVTVTGDPVQDMVCKKTRNEMAIKHLREQNFQLTRALTKIAHSPNRRVKNSPNHEHTGI